MLIHETGKDYKQAVQEAISKAKSIGQSLKTFEIEAEPAVKEITKDGHTVTEVTLKATGADKNYSQFSINYLKGEIEGHGNDASETFSKLWKSQHMPKGDDVSPWIGRKTYPTIVETITGEPNDIDHIGSIGLLKGKCYDPDTLKRWDGQRQEFEKTLKAKAPAIISAVRQQYEASIVLMATMAGKIEYKDLDKDFITTIDHSTEATKNAPARIDIVKTKTITDKKAELDYINKTLPLTRGIIHLYGKVKDLIKASGDLETMKAQADAMELEKPLIEGDVKSYEEEQAKKAKAEARQDKKAEKDADLRANVREMATVYHVPTADIATFTHLSTAKVEEILRDAGYDSAKLYSEQGKAKVNVIPGGDKVRVTPIFNNNNVEAEKIKSATAVDKMSANDKDAKLRRTIFNMHSVFTSEEIAKYLDLSEIFVARVLDESD